jgi:phosphate transport system ATP-binding protein
MDAASPTLSGQLQTVLETRNVSVYYGSSLGLQSVSMSIPKNQITALIGPSGCGKSTLIRCFNRLNDLIPDARVEGSILFNGVDITQKIDLVQLRRRIGMVFQKPNPFPKSIYGNIAYGAKINGYNQDMDELVERSLRRVSLWSEVKDKLSQSGSSLSGGQQQRLCIARAIAIEPEVILMDEPCSSLDPISTARIENLMDELKQHYTIVIVTHNMQQAARVSDMTAFFNAAADETGNRYGYLVEFAPSEVIFNHPVQQLTKDYVCGRFG